MTGEVNILDLPDDELEAAFAASTADAVEESDTSTPANVPAEPDPATVAEAALGDDDVDDTADKADDIDDVDDPVAGDAIDPDADDDADSDASADTADDAGDADLDADTDDAAADNTDTADDKAAKAVDYEAEYGRLLAPFKANGRDIKIDTVDEAITLMQMGANYNKKMAELKPNLKLIKMLDNNELLDMDKLTYLIDLSKKDPAAIQKLVKDSGINPLDMDLEKGEEYQPQNYAVEDKEVELDGILDDIRDTDSYATTIDVLGNKWDDASKKVLLGEPEIIRVINGHVASGVFDTIQGEIDKKRMLGQLEGLSDLEAYQTVGDEINARGGFQVQDAQPKSKPSEPKVRTSKKSEIPDPKRAKKKAAGSTKSAASTKAEEPSDPLDMSDEDFEKMSSKAFKI